MKNIRFNNKKKMNLIHVHCLKYGFANNEYLIQDLNDRIKSFIKNSCSKPYLYNKRIIKYINILLNSI